MQMHQNDHIIYKINPLILLKAYIFVNNMHQAHMIYIDMVIQPKSFIRSIQIVLDNDVTIHYTYLPDNQIKEIQVLQFLAKIIIHTILYYNTYQAFPWTNFYWQASQSDIPFEWVELSYNTAPLIHYTRTLPSSSMINLKPFFRNISILSIITDSLVAGNDNGNGLEYNYIWQSHHVQQIYWINVWCSITVSCLRRS